MVQSQLNPKLNFPETRTLDKVDEEFNAPLYSITLYKKSIIIAVGQINTNFQEQYNIVYFPIYLIDNKNVILQIGVFESFSNTLPNMLDDQGDLDLNLIGEPLIYSFIKTNLSLLVNRNNKSLEKSFYDKDEKEYEEEDVEQHSEEDQEYGEEYGEEDKGEELEDGDKSEKIKEGYKKDEKEKEIEDGEEDEEDPEEEDEDDEKSVESKLDKDKINNDQLEFKKIFEMEQKEFINTQATTWIEKYFKNNNFNIVDNEAGGDCLFAVIRDGLETIGKKVLVSELRLKLASEANEEIFNNYKEHYDMYKSAIDKSNSELKDLVKKNKQLKIELSATDDRKDHKRIILEANKVKEDFERIKRELSFEEELLKEYKFMKNIKTLEEFKAVLMTCKFWADTWAISVLERILNIKLIIFSKEEYSSDSNYNNKNIIFCGQLNEEIVPGMKFNPSYYILLEYTGDHYKLITYKKKGAFTFKELPFQIKKLVSDKCYEIGVGPYSIIPDFEDFKVISSKSILGDREGGLVNETDSLNPLYNNDDILLIDESSLDYFPGKKPGEKVLMKDISKFSNLYNIEDWRKKLDNSWIGDELEVDGKRWKSVDHYLMGMKFKKHNPSYYNKFSLDSNDKISHNLKLARAVSNKNGIYKKRQLRPSYIKLDENYDIILPEIINKALYVKFIQNPEMKYLLKSTNRAKLLSCKKKKNPTVAIELMKIRKLIE